MIKAVFLYSMLKGSIWVPLPRNFDHSPQQQLTITARTYIVDPKILSIDFTKEMMYGSRFSAQISHQLVCLFGKKTALIERGIRYLAFPNACGTIIHFSQKNGPSIMARSSPTTTRLIQHPAQPTNTKRGTETIATAMGKITICLSSPQKR